MVQGQQIAAGQTCILLETKNRTPLGGSGVRRLVPARGGGKAGIKRQVEAALTPERSETGYPAITAASGSVTSSKRTKAWKMCI